VIVPDPNFRPNPDRAIFIQGTIDQGTIDRLTPEIMRLTAGDRGPITVYIDSAGGNVASAEVILKLLQATNQDNDPPCWLITVVTSRAASAAADLLSSGNYAIAYPDSTLLYHGVRTPSLTGITVELASFLAESLKISNDRTQWRSLESPSGVSCFDSWDCVGNLKNIGLRRENRSYPNWTASSRCSATIFQQKQNL
jgi:ATP-dependent protease ClpP protease subunit